MTTELGVNEEYAAEQAAEKSAGTLPTEATEDPLHERKTSLLQQFIDQSVKEDEDIAQKHYLDNLDEFMDEDSEPDEASIEASIDSEDMDQYHESPSMSSTDSRDSHRASQPKEVKPKQLQIVSPLSNDLDEHSRDNGRSSGVQLAQPSALPKKKLLNIIHSDDISENLSINSTLSSASQIQHDYIRLRGSFLLFGVAIPDINELTEGSSSELLPVQKQVNESPRTLIAPKSNAALLSEDYDPDSQNGEHEERTTISSSSVSNVVSMCSLSDTFKPIDVKRKKLEIDVDFIAERMTELMKKNEVLLKVPKDESDQQLSVSTRICKLFMRELISRAVTYVEDSTGRLSRNLDKHKLAMELVSLMSQIRVEADKKNILDSAVSDHFLRKKQMSFITNNNQDNAFNYKRWQMALVKLDRLLEVQRKTFDLAHSQSLKLNEELEQARVDSDEKITSFEQVVRETLLTNDSFSHLSGYVQDVLKRMRNIRDELSEMRLELLLTQHRFADLQKQSNELENVASGFKLRDYLNQQTETIILNTKIAERTAELNRLRARVHFDMHALAHVKCKIHMDRKNYLSLRRQREKCAETVHKYKDRIHQGNQRHNSIQRQLYKLRESGELMFHPILMEDYDQTLEYLKAKSASVEKLRSDFAFLTKRITIMDPTNVDILSIKPPSRSGTANKVSFRVTGGSIL